jgi:putative membrane protein
MRLFATVLGLALVSAVPAGAQFGNPAGMAPDTLKKAPGQPMAHQTNYQDRLFAQLAAAGGLAEVRFGELAGKSQNADVKDFARRMVDDHRLANDRLKQLATAGKIPVPEGLDNEHEQMRVQLEKLTDNAFDLAYISGQIVDHQKTVQLLEWEIDSGQDGDIQRFAADTLPVVLEHLRIAGNIKASLINPQVADALKTK